MTAVVSIKKRRNKRLISEELRASSIIPVIAYSEDDHLFLSDDQTMGFGFMCDPLVGADSKMQERVNSFINQDYPDGTIMQIVLFRSPDINQQMYQMLGLRDGHRDPLLEEVIQSRVKFLQHHTHQRIFARSDRGIFDNGLIQDLKLIITLKVPINDIHPSKKEMGEFADLRTKVESSLQTIGLRPRALTAVSYVRLLSTMINWGPGASWKNEASEWEPDKPICEQVFDYDTDIEVSKDGVRLGGQYVKVLSAKKLPDVFYFGDAITYVGDLSGGGSNIKDNYMVVTNVHFPNPESLKKAMETKRSATVKQALGPMLNFVPVLADKKHGFDVLYDSMKEGSRPLKISYSVVIFSDTKEHADSAATRARGLWGEQRFVLMEDKFIALPMFINCLPLCADNNAVRDLFRYKTMTAEQAAVLVPIFGEWKGTGTFHASLISRNGQLMSVSLHDSETNKNAVIAAESGSGKSFWINELIFSYISEGAQVWVIDAGKSYEKLSEMLKGDFLQFDDQTKICLNPFELIENYDDEEDAVVSIVSAMASAKGLLDEFQISGLKQAMAEVWNEKGKRMIVDDVASRCLANRDQRIKDIGMQLYAFTSQGGYGKYFSGQNNVNFQNQFTVLELDELQGRRHLRQVVLLQLIYQIQQEVFLGERNRKKIVIVDEAWDLLKEGEVATFMEHAYRKFRKYGGSVIIATQSVNDLYENAVGRAIAENSANMYLLGQTEETVESVKRSGRLAMSDGAFNLLKTVRTVKGVYSEIFVKTGQSGAGVGRLVVGEFQKLLYSTDPPDVHAIESYVQQGLSVPNAIHAVLRDRGQASGEGVAR